MLASRLAVTGRQFPEPKRKWTLFKSFGGETAELSANIKPSLTALALPQRENLMPIQFLDFAESGDKIRKAIGLIEGELVTFNYPKEQYPITSFRVPKSAFFLPARAFLLALKAQAKILGYLNDEHFNCQVPWDRRVGLPSHPSLVADVLKYVQIFKPDERTKAVLESFSAWTSFAKETITCCCGRGWNSRKAALDFMLNHIFEVKDSKLVIKQLVGVKSDDDSHLAHHYSNFQQPSRQYGDLSIIFVYENAVHLTDPIAVESLDYKMAEQFNIAEFTGRINTACGYKFEATQDEVKNDRLVE